MPSTQAKINRVLKSTNPVSFTEEARRIKARLTTVESKIQNTDTDAVEAFKAEVKADLKKISDSIDKLDERMNKTTEVLSTNKKFASLL